MIPKGRELFIPQVYLQLSLIVIQYPRKEKGNPRKGKRHEFRSVPLDTQGADYNDVRDYYFGLSFRTLIWGKEPRL